MMFDWQPIETAPKTGEIILTTWHDTPVLASYGDGSKPDDPPGFRIVILGRDGRYGIHGNYAPFMPKYWLPIKESQLECLSVTRHNPR